MLRGRGGLPGAGDSDRARRRGCRRLRGPSRIWRRQGHSRGAPRGRHHRPLTLVKRALFAADPQLGTHPAAVGHAQVEALDIEAVRIWLGDVRITFSRGGRDPDYTETAARPSWKRRRFGSGWPWAAAGRGSPSCSPPDLSSGSVTHQPQVSDQQLAMVARSILSLL